MSLFKKIRSPKTIGRHLLCAVFFFITHQATAQPPTFTTQHIKFASAGDSLAGTLFKAVKATAGVVLVHGSGQEKRMMEFATLLAGNGITVFTYDKRGVGESGGVYAGPEVGSNNVDSANLNLLALDAAAAVNSLSAYLSNDQMPIGLVGASQAGWIIPLAAVNNKKVRFMTIFSGALVTVKEQLRFQFYTNGNAGFWNTHTEEDARKHIMSDPDKYEFTDTDPRKSLSSLSIPGLWIFGGKDIQVPVNLSIEHLNVLKANNKAFEYKLYPALGHNTAFTSSPAPVMTAIKWMKQIKMLKAGKH